MKTGLTSEGRARCMRMSWTIFVSTAQNTPLVSGKNLAIQNIYRCNEANTIYLGVNEKRFCAHEMDRTHMVRLPRGWEQQRHRAAIV
jgi:hypothetical protein